MTLVLDRFLLKVLREIELLPCPFCQGNAEFRYGESEREEPWQIICDPEQNDCEVFPETMHYSTPDEAAAAWNRRVPVPSQDETRTTP